ncbi:MAG: toll/interleukin-1 receptor domain-containing protein [Saprospiraceae bacterium]
MPYRVFISHSSHDTWVAKQMNSKVFLSYSHNDQPLASFLARELGKHQIIIWSDDQIKPGEEWEDAISKALKEADLYMPLVSSAFLGSDFTVADRRRLWSAQKHVANFGGRGY